MFGAFVSWKDIRPFVPMTPEPMFVQLTRFVEASMPMVNIGVETTFRLKYPFVPKPLCVSTGVAGTTVTAAV